MLSSQGSWTNKYFQEVKKDGKWQYQCLACNKKGKRKYLAKLKGGTSTNRIKHLRKMHKMIPPEKKGPEKKGAKEKPGKLWALR